MPVQFINETITDILFEEDMPLIVLKGVVQNDQTEELEMALEKLIEKGYNKVALDMSDVSHLCSSALGILVSYKRDFTDANGDLKLIIKNDELMRLFEITMLDKSFEMYNSRQELYDANPSFSQ